MLLLRKSYIEISINIEAGYLYQKWKGYCRNNDFIKIIDFSMSSLEKYNIHKIINDVSEQHVVSPKNQNYVKNSILNFYIKNKKFKMAFIIKKNTINDRCVESHNNSLNKEINEKITQTYLNIEDAKKWILKL